MECSPVVRLLERPAGWNCILVLGEIALRLLCCRSPLLVSASPTDGFDWFPQILGVRASCGVWGRNLAKLSNRGAYIGFSVISVLARFGIYLSLVMIRMRYRYGREDTELLNQLSKGKRQYGEKSECVLNFDGFEIR